MGIYTNFSGGYGSSINYTDVEPFVGESFNYHELGIIAATEMAANHNAFMKGIALSELAAFEQTGSTDVLYEGVDIKGIFEKIKMFFKKIIEKIHKIFHTFIAKMSSWFGGNKAFVDKYTKEVIKGWGNVKNDWEFKGYNFNNVIKTKTTSNDLRVDAKDNTGKEIAAFLSSGQNIDDFTAQMVAGNSGKYQKVTRGGTHWKKKDGTYTDNDPSADDSGDGKVYKPVSKSAADFAGNNKAELANYREKLSDIKDANRKLIIDALDNSTATFPVVFTLESSGGYEQAEFTEELFKVFRGGEDSKQDLKKSEIETCYGSISGMMTFIKEFDSTKKNLEKAEKDITKQIDDLIKRVDKAEDAAIKDKNDTAANETRVQVATFFQSFWGGISEMVTQAFSAMLQATKDACVQAKEIAVKVIGQSKKMTEESYDYSSNGGSFDFISSVKLV